MKNAVLFAIGCAASYLLGALFMWAIKNQEDPVQDFVAQCQKSQFYFADGVGIQCPAVIDNRKEQK